jgi:uncharacterized protein (DUF934 family)
MAVLNLAWGGTAAVSSDPWVTVADGDAVPKARVIVPIARFKAEAGAILAAAVAVGVEISGADRVEDLAPWTDKLALVVLRFGFFKDGRLFTSARLLRERLKFRGELRATGDFLPDQVLFLLRSGVNTLEVADNFPLETLNRVLKAYSVRYQRALDDQPVIVDQRLKGNGA